MVSFAVLRHRPFRNLWIGQTVSQLGDSLYWLVFLYMADHVSKDPRMVGLVGAAGAIPFVVFGPLAGVLADRVDRRFLMLFADYMSAAITFGLAMYALKEPNPPVWVLLVAAFLLSTVNTVFFPARSASVPRLVPPGDVVAANALNEATRQTVMMVGMAVSAVGLGALYLAAPNLFFLTSVAFNSATFLVSAFFVSRLPNLAPLRGEVPSGEPGGVAKRVVADMREGLAAVSQDPLIRLALPVNMLSTLAVSGFFVVYLAFNRAWYGGDYQTLAWIELAFAAPMVFASLAVGRMTIARPGRWIIAGHLGLGGAVAAMAFCRPYWSMLIINAVCALFLPLIIIPLQSYLQLAVPDALRGRVNSTWSMLSQAMNPLGVLAIGPLLTWLGIEKCLIAMGVGMALAGMVGFASRRFLNTEMPSARPQAA